jgi:hypothetical protein
LVAAKMFKSSSLRLGGSSLSPLMTLRAAPFYPQRRTSSLNPLQP